MQSIKKTGRAIIADSGWVEGGIAAEIATSIYGECFSYLQSSLLRLGLPSTAACSRTLEEVYYPKCATIIEAAHVTLQNKKLTSINCLTKDLPGLITF